MASTRKIEHLEYSCPDCGFTGCHGEFCPSAGDFKYEKEMWEKYDRERCPCGVNHEMEKYL